MALAKKRHGTLVLTLFLFFSLLILSLRVEERNLPLSFLNRLLVVLTAGAERGVTAASKTASGLLQGYVALVAVSSENRQIREELGQVRTENEQLKESLREQGRLRTLLELKEKAPWTTTGARVIATDPSGLFQAVWVDKGKGDGVVSDMAVITWEGLVGRTVRVFNGTSQVLLISDPNSAVDALVARTRDSGLVYGRSRNGLLMRYLPLSATVAPGDLVITSGLGGVFPKGIPVGRVNHVRRQKSGIFLEVEVEPRARLESLEEVLMILPEKAGGDLPGVNPG